MNGDHAHSAPAIDWSIDDADGPIQGPLALAFLRDRRLALRLGERQVALLLGDGRLQAAFPAGKHELLIGRDGIDPDWSLLFLAPGQGLAVRWTAGSPLRCRGDDAPSLIGTCILEIVDPLAFHGTFLSGAGTVDATFALLLVDRLAQGAVAACLAPPPGDAGPWSPTAVQARLTGLGPNDLADELLPCGLACRRLTLYTTQPPVDHERPATPLAQAGETIPMSGHSEELRRH